MSLRTGGQKEQPPSMAKKDGLRRRLYHLFSRSEVNLKELGKRETEESCSRLVGARNYPAGWDKDQRWKRPRKQRPTEKVSEEDASATPGKPAAGKPSVSSKSQRSASKARSLSYSEPDLWRNGFLRKFGGLAWRKQRNSHLQIPTSGSWPLGRLQRPAVGSDVDMRGRSHSGPTLDDIRKQERPRPTSQPSDIDSIGTSPVPSISLDSLLCCGDGSSWEGSFSLSNPSLSCSIAPEMKGEVLKLPSVLEESSKAPRLLSEWVESALSGYLSSRFSHITVMEEPENLSFSSGLGESIPEQVSGVEEPKIAPPSPPMEEPLMIVETPQTSLGKKGSKIRYEIRITLTKKEDKENGMAEVGPIAGCGQRALPSHPSGEGTLSLGVAELEETEEQRHPKLAQPAPQVSARKEFQNCTGLHRVGTCKLCRRILTPDTVNPEATATAALRWESETRQGEGKDPSQTDELQLGDGPPEEGTDVIAPDPLADSFSKSSGSSQASSERELHPRRPCDIRSGLFCIQHSMEKVTVSSHRAGKGSSNISFKWKKTDLPNQESKPSFSKMTSASQMTEKASARSHSPSRVSMLLEAWEKGLVGTDATDSPSASDSRRSRSPVHSRRLRFSKETSRPLFPSNPRNSLSPVRPSVNAQRSISPADTRRSFSPTDNRQSLSPTCFPADTRRSHSPAHARRSLSPANATQLFSPVQSRRSLFLGDARRSRSPTKTRPSLSLADNRWSHSPADTRRSFSPAGTRRSHSPADTRQSLSPSNARHSCLPGDTQGPSSSADVRNPSSPAESQNSSSTAENHCSSSPVDSPSSPSPDTRSLPSVADIRRLYSSGNAKCLSSPKDSRCPHSSAENGHSSSSANTRYPSSLEEKTHPSASTQIKDSSSLADTRWPFPPAEPMCSSSPTDARLSSSPANAKFTSSPADGSGSPSPPESRSFSPTSFGKRSHALSPPRDFTAHGPVFAQVYSPSPKPKILVKTEMQDTNSTTAGQSQGENHCGYVTDSYPGSEYQQEREVHITDGSWEENLPPIPVSTRVAEFQRKSYISNSTSPATGPASPRECNPPNTAMLTDQTESYPSRSGNSIYSSGGNYMPSVMSTQPSAGPCVLSPLPHAVSSSTVVTSQTQWYSPKGSNMVVFRSDRQVIVPQAGTTTVYRAGREIVMSSSGTESGSKSQKEESLASSSVTRISPKESWQPQDNLHDTNSPKITPASFLDVCNHSAVSSQPESCMTQSRDAGMSDGQRQRCTLLPNPAFTSNRDATTFEEGVVPFSTPQRDCSLHSKPVFQRNSNLFAESRSERGESMTDPGDSVANGPEQDNILSKREAVSLSGSQRLWCPLDAEEEISVSRKSSGSQEVGPQDQKLISQTELIKEQHSPRKDSLVFTPDSNVTLAETTNSSEEPPSHKNGNRNSKAEPEPEELVDMELFVDTLRNMEPAELRKPLKLLPRSTRPSTLAKHTVLPPIHEDHITPKSQVCLPAALGELFALTEEKNSEEREDLKKEDAGFSEEETEEIENPYGSMDEKIQEKEQDRKPYPWENKSFKTEEEIGSFLGKLQQGLGNQEVSVIAPKALANQTNLIRANILKGISLLSGLPDKKVVEDNKPYSRLDNSLLYSRFISPQSQSRETSKGKDVRCSIIFLNPGAPKGNKEHQTFPSGIHMSSESPPSGTQAEPFSRVPGASRSTKEMTVQSKGTESPSRSAAQQQEENKLPKKVNVRPGKIILYSESGFGGQKREIWGDIADATFWPLSHTISIRVIRGGWVMYEKPRFYGRKCVLAEGDVEITNPWRMYNKDGAEAEDAPFRIGSLKRVVRDYKIPEISLFSEENGEGTKQRFTDSSEDTRMYSQPLRAASIIVYSGLWLVYSKPFFDDDPYVLEPGGYPSLQAWGAKDPSVCSIHPIKLGCPVVEKPGEPKAVIYERPHFQGHSWEVSRDIYNVKKPENNQDSGMPTAGSLRIMGGCWVGYEKEGFRGHQYLLEEGEYYDWSQWGGYNEHLVSLRLIRTDFLNPALVLFEAMDFEEGPSIELSEALPDVELASYGTMTQSIHVLSGVWVAYEDKNFAGEQYILEKGVYRNCEDWGASNCQISSVQPILQVGEHSLHFISKIQLFSDPDFLGNYVSFEEDQALLPENFIPRSCRVNGGSWILYDGPQFDGEQHVLSEGEYPTLTSMGCLFTTAIRSLKKVPIFFSEPSIFLHGLECFEGKEIELNAEVRSLQAEGFNNHVLSVRVKGGIWVLCEHSDFRGRQWLLDRMEITNWLTYSGLQHIGSLYPIRQKRIYFQIKNEELKSFLSVPDDVEDMKAGRVLVSELSDSSSSIWYYEDGLLKNQASANMSLQVIGPAGKGSKVVLWSESRVPRQTWRIDSSGRICSQMFEDKVLDVKGGRAYDQDHAILWDSSEERPTQIWHIQVL